MVVDAIKIVMQQQSLSQNEAMAAMQAILTQVEPSQVAALLTLLSYRKETIAELTGMREAIIAQAMKINSHFPVMDIVGTGGDGANTVNISTGAAILASAAGVVVLKHGNRAITSRCGAADVLEALNVPIELTAKAILHALHSLGIAFIFAEKAHPILAKLKPIRQALPFATTINKLGPLLNPARPAYLLLGVARREQLPVMSQLVKNLPEVKRALVYHGQGLDELTPLGVIEAYDIQAGHCAPITIDPKDLGFAPCKVTDLQGGMAQYNATLLKQSLAGEVSAISDSLILTAGAAIWIYGKAETLSQGVEKARQLHQSGAGLQRLTDWVAHYANIKTV